MDDVDRTLLVTEIEHLREQVNKLRAERDACRKALIRLTDVIRQDGHGFHDGTDLGRAFKAGLRALANCEEKRDE